MFLVSLNDLDRGGCHLPSMKRRWQESGERHRGCRARRETAAAVERGTLGIAEMNQMRPGFALSTLYHLHLDTSALRVRVCGSCCWQALQRKGGPKWLSNFKLLSRTFIPWRVFHILLRLLSGHVGTSSCCCGGTWAWVKGTFDLQWPLLAIYGEGNTVSSGAFKSGVFDSFSKRAICF